MLFGMYTDFSHAVVAAVDFGFKVRSDTQDIDIVLVVCADSQDMEGLMVVSNIESTSIGCTDGRERPSTSILIVAVADLVESMVKG